MISIVPVQFARERLLRVLNLSSSKHPCGPSLSPVSLCEMFSGSLDGLRNSVVLQAGLCPQGRICKLASGFSWPAPSFPALGQSQKGPRLSEREFLLAVSCDCWNIGMGPSQKLSRPTGFILAMCFCLLPWPLPCLLPLGPLAPEQQVLALWLLLLTLTHSRCLPFPLSSTPCHPCHPHPIQPSATP